MAATVTIDKEYFMTLLRRAEFHVSGQDLTTPVNLPIVSIPKVDHDNLLQIAQEYSALKEALYRGGIAPETLKILIQGDSGTPQPDGVLDNTSSLTGGDDYLYDSQKPTAPSRQSANIYGSYTGQSAVWSSKEHGSPRSKPKPSFYGRKYSSGHDENSHPSEPDRDDHSRVLPKPERQQYARAEQRSIVAQNLSDRTTHKDLLQVIRGGTVLDIFLRNNERSASISFVEGSAAQDFMNYVRRSDIYIHGKRVEWAWNDRQFILPGHVAYKISLGATRNFVIRNAHPSITEERLREDLDHIHNLVILDITYRNGDARISLNSIHNAIFAQTCLLSRLAYKGNKIEWFPDECSSPLPKQPLLPKKENGVSQVRKANTPSNRFQMLNMDGTEDTSDGDSEGSEDETMLPAFSNMKISHRSPWNPTTVAA
ncbi:MAG: hypothetical protein HETSPECPRED_003965 [Heterodermia speciosa]|uniref:RRM domain-containing protein n=1 Tax=Heterodermia speciosa TaxID=116794 RepID=A0A8H3F7J4_9LECA|nr:MAG: hypothetical protein HETSPECPRED_003965 [Heterodermia speciosa]